MAIEHISLDDWHLWFAELHIDSLRHFGALVEQSVESERRAFESLVDAAAAALGEPQRSEFYEWHQSEHHRYAAELPALGREFVLIKGFMFLDDQLAEIANWLGRRTGAQFSRKKSPGQSRRTLEYLDSCHNVRLTPQQEHDLKAFRTVRNAIAHCDGALTTIERESIGRWFLSDLMELEVGRVLFIGPIHEQVADTIAAILSHVDAQISRS